MALQIDLHLDLLQIILISLQQSLRSLGNFLFMYLTLGATTKLLLGCLFKLGETHNSGTLDLLS